MTDGDGGSLLLPQTGSSLSDISHDSKEKSCRTDGVKDNVETLASKSADDDDSYNLMSDMMAISTRSWTTNKVKSSNVTAFVTFLKALFGVSLLSSPRVLQETGLPLGTLIYILLVGACVTSCWLLLQARNKVVMTSADTPRRPNLVGHNVDTFVDDDISETSVEPQHIITYGELGRKLLGAKQSVVINFLIVSLHICFGSGLVAVSSRQIALVLGWESQDDDEVEEEYAAEDDPNNDEYAAVSTGNDTMSLWLCSTILSTILFPIIAALLQFRNVKDLFWICFVGLVIYLFGCVGTMLYTTLSVDSNGDSSVWDVPEDAWEWKWSGVPNFVASTLCAMEGINLALPIANQLAKSSSSQSGSQSSRGHNEPIPIVTAVVGCFGMLTLSVAYLGYLGGLGGGSGTKHDNENNEDDDAAVSCYVITRCIDSELLIDIYQVSLACALILTLPIILYPSLELLEIWADERARQIRTGRTMSNRTLQNSWNGFVWGAPSESFRRNVIMQDKVFGASPYIPFFHRHWKLRIGHALAVCFFAVIDRQFERAFVLFKGFGLSLACFLLPCFLFIKAYSFSAVLSSPMLMTAMAGLTGLGITNMVLIGLSVFTKHNFVPVLIHEGPGGPHHEHHDD